jgi:hypothetical protein
MSRRAPAPAEPSRLGRWACGVVGLVVGLWFALEGMVVLAFGRAPLHVVRGVVASVLAAVVVGMWAFGKPAAPGWRAVVAAGLVVLYLALSIAFAR